MTRRFVLFGAALVLGAALYACGGGGGGGNATIPLGPTTGPQPSSGSPANDGSAKLTIVIPPASQQNKHMPRTPKFVSASTQSMTAALVLTSPATPEPLGTPIALTSGSTACGTPAPNGGLNCVANISVPYGSDNLQISTFASTNGTGAALSTGDTGPFTVGAGSPAPSLSLSLNGVPSTVSLALTSSTLPVGYSGSTGVIVQAYDSSGNLIVGPGTFSAPIPIAKSSGDPYDTVTLGAGSATSPGQVIPLEYNGGTNTGTTITAGGSGVSSGSVTFTATGAALTNTLLYDTQIGELFYPYDVAAASNGTAAILGHLYCEECDSYDGIALVSSTGAQTLFSGNTTDPFATSSPPPGYTGTYSPEPEPTTTPVPGMTFVPGMSATLDYEYDSPYGAYDSIAMSGTNVYYGGSISSYNAASSQYNCYGSPLTTGTLGVLNTATGTTVEYPLSGYPSYIKVDPSGNVWWIEYAGQCNGYYLQFNGISDYTAIGFLPAGGGTPTETALNTIIPQSADAYANIVDMAIATGTSGTYMYLADQGNGEVWQIPITSGGTISATTVSAQPTNGETQPLAIAAASDGTTNGTAVWSDSESANSSTYYDYVLGNKAFSDANLVQSLFPMSDFLSCGMAYADGSFWAADYGEGDGPCDYSSNGPAGVGRISGITGGSSTPVIGYYLMPSQGEVLTSVASAGGYLWAVDDEYGFINMIQYGTPSSGTITINATRRIGPQIRRRNPYRGIPGPHGARRALRHPAGTSITKH